MFFLTLNNRKRRLGLALTQLIIVNCSQQAPQIGTYQSEKPIGAQTNKNTDNKQQTDCTSGTCPLGTGSTSTTTTQSDNKQQQNTDIQGWDLLLNQACSNKQNLADLISQLNMPTCQEGQEPGRVVFKGPHTDRHQEQHADLNILLRGMVCNNDSHSLHFQDGPVNADAPRIYSVLNPSVDRTSGVKQTYSVFNWNWPANVTTDAQGYSSEVGSRGSVISGGIQTTTAVGFKTVVGTNILVPFRPNANIGGDYNVMVLYATENQITLKYTLEDNVKMGYTLHLIGLCVHQKIVNSFRQLKDSGERPALKIGDSLGNSLGTEIIFIIRDTGTFMNPLESNHWWQ